MISFSKYYHFTAEDVEFIEAVDNTVGDYPYKLIVHFKSGKSCSVNYNDSKSRDTVRNNMVRQIECEKRTDTEKTLNMLALLNYAVERIDKRQLRIWRQLKALLGVPVEEE